MFNIFLVFTGIGLVTPIMPTYMNTLGMIGKVAGPAIAGFLFDYNINVPYICAALALLLCFIISVQWGKHR
nr:hypothetical protein [Paenibacillus macquariensis]